MDHFVVQRFGNLGTGSSDVRRSIALLRFRHECELRYDDDVPADVKDAPIHHTSLVVEDTKLGRLLHEIFDVFGCVVGSDTNEDEHAETVALSYFFATDVDGCGTCSLNEEAHEVGVLLLFGCFPFLIEVLFTSTCSVLDRHVCIIIIVITSIATEIEADQKASLVVCLYVKYMCIACNKQ